MRFLRTLAVLAIFSACSPSAPQCHGSGCCDYVACVKKTTGADLESTYGTSGSCWSTTQAMADACEAACKSGLPQLKAMYPDAGCN